MNAKASIAALLATAGALLPAAVAAQLDEVSRPPRQVFRSPAGQTEVNYYDGGGLTAETEVPTSSRFWTTGGGSGGGGAPTPCGEFIQLNYVPWYPDGPDEDPEYVRQDVVTPSLSWTYTETPASYDWDVSSTSAAWAAASPWQQDLFAGAYGATRPLSELERRFFVECADPNNPGNAQPRAFVDVPPDDPFWNVFDRIGDLWNQIQLPSFTLGTAPEVDFYGGYVVNMPTWLQITEEVWQPYFSPVDNYRGFSSRLELFPSELTYSINPSWGPATSTTCSVPTSVNLEFDHGWDWDDSGLYPPRPELPRYSTRGNPSELVGDFGGCAWVPDGEGKVDIRATVTYRVMFVVNGFGQELSTYEWSSELASFDVGELLASSIVPGSGGS